MRWIVPVCLCLVGCFPNTNISLSTESMADTNMTNLTRVSLGMNQAQVLKVMHQPYNKQQVEREGNRYDIWFYVTRVTGLDQSRLVRQNVTPLIFKNGVLTGWGHNYYNFIFKEPVEKPKPLPEEKEENKKLEDVLTHPKVGGPEPTIYESSPSSPAKKPPPPKAGPAPLSPPTQPKEPKQPEAKPTPPPQQPEPAQPKLAPPPPPPNLNQTTSMSSKPKEKAPEKEEEEEKPLLDDEDRKRLEEENEENFDYW